MGYAQILIQTNTTYTVRIGNKLFESNDLLQRVINISKKTLALMDDILLLLSYESSKITLNFFPVNIVSVINSSLTVIAPLAAEKRLRIETDYDRAPAEIITDPARLERVLIILLNNAIKYTTTGVINISCETLAGEKYSIAIKDTGVGIPAAETQKVFEPFFQASNNQTVDRDRGNGLGLTIANSLVKLLSGEISLKSQVESGSEFKLTLPDLPIIPGN